jgi:hypothetical protein
MRRDFVRVKDAPAIGARDDRSDARSPHGNLRLDDIACAVSQRSIGDPVVAGAFAPKSLPGIPHGRTAARALSVTN